MTPDLPDQADQALMRRVLDLLAGSGVRPGVQLNSAHAEVVARTWFREVGWTQDAWGNYKHPEVADTRIVVTDRSVKVQRKIGKHWTGYRTYTLIDWSTGRLAILAKRAGTDDEKAAAESAKQVRRTAKAKAQDRRKREAARRTALAFLRQWSLWTLRDRGLLVDYLAGREDARSLAQRPDVKAVTAEAEARVEEVMQRALDGADLDAEEPPWSLDVPPMPWIDRGYYEWVEDDRTISFGHKAGTTEFLIGKIDDLGFGIDPRTFRMRMTWQGPRQGDGYLAGVIHPPVVGLGGGGRGPEVVVTLIGAHEKGRGVGRRLVAAAGRLARGYGSDAFMVEALTDEGRSFFEHLVQRGDLLDLGPVSKTGQRYGMSS